MIPGLAELYQRTKRGRQILRALEAHLDANGVHGLEEHFNIIAVFKAIALEIAEIKQEMQYMGIAEAEQENFNEN